MDSVNVFCRLCAESMPPNKLVDLQYDFEKRDDISDKLSRLNASTEFFDSKLPGTVCFECISSLNKAHEFVINVERSQSVLKDIFHLRYVKQEAASDDECSIGDANVGTVDIQIKAESGHESSEDCKPETKPAKVKKSKSIDSIPLSKFKETWASYSWFCTYCETMFPTIDELHAHSLSVHGACNPYRCTECKTRKENLEKFLIHVQRHSQQLKFSCYKCLKKFKTVHQARKHVKAVHLKSEFNCSGCGSTFTNSEDLKQHKDTYLKVKYLREVPGSKYDNGLCCTICSKEFKSRSSLNTHILTHSERKREQICEICGKCFYLKHNLACHMVMHSEERPHKCQICKLSFKTSLRLRHHINVHNNDKPFSCEQCGRRFRLLKQLKNHSIIHTDSLPYQCQHCEKRFRFKTILNNHVRLHTGIKPYSCETCQRDFSNWSNYNKHMKRKHNQDTSKKKHTPEGVYPIDPTTGEVMILPETKQVLEWKKQILQGTRPRRKPAEASETVPIPQMQNESIVKTENALT